MQQFSVSENISQLRARIWYGNSLLGITEKNRLILLQSLIKYIICLETTLKTGSTLYHAATKKIKLKYMYTAYFKSNIC